MTWNLHIVGTSDPAELNKAVEAFVENLKGSGFVVTQAVLTTDFGPATVITTTPGTTAATTPPNATPPAPAPTPTPTPATPPTTHPNPTTTVPA